VIYRVAAATANPDDFNYSFLCLCVHDFKHSGPPLKIGTTVRYLSKPYVHTHPHRHRLSCMAPPALHKNPRSKVDLEPTPHPF
jgi:hypothetical protein